MRIAIFGLGYVGSVTGACLARMGHSVCGVDVSRVKVEMINAGHSPVLERGLERLIAEQVRRGALRASRDPREAMRGAELSLVCVGTPARPEGNADLTHIRHAAREIGRALSSAHGFHTVVMRSTVPPGTVRNVVIPALERGSGLRAGRDFGACFHPEFLREGTSIHDFFHPPLNVVGCEVPRSARQLLELWKALPAPLCLTTLEVAEMVKYASNAFHALKVTFANEIGALSKNLGIDGREVMEFLARDRKLSVSPLYLRPGFAFGGPCLPKDVRVLERLGRRQGVEVPLLANILESNARHLRRAANLVLATRKKRIGVLGLVFKSQTDDLRGSPACALVQLLLRANRQVRIYEPRVEISRLLGANRAFIEKALPQLSRLLVNSPEELLAFSEVVVLAGTHGEFAPVVHGLRKSQTLVDLVGWAGMGPTEPGDYRGICWVQPAHRPAS